MTRINQQNILNDDLSIILSYSMRTCWTSLGEKEHLFQASGRKPSICAMGLICHLLTDGKINDQRVLVCYEVESSHCLET